MFTSIILSLLVVPVVFEMVDDFKLRVLRRLGLRSAAGAQTAAAP